MKFNLSRLEDKYIKDINNFRIGYKGLPHKEYIELFKIYRNEELSFNVRIEAKNKIIKSLIPFVIHIAKKYGNRGVHASFLDLVQEGNLALLRVVDGYDPKKSTLGTYAFYAIKNAIWVALKYKNSLIGYSKYGIPNYISMDRKVGQKWSRSGSAGGLTLHDIIPCTQNIESLSENKKQHLRAELREMLSILPERSREILYARYYRGETLEKIGKKYDLCKERIRQIEEESLDKLRYELSIGGNKYVYCKSSE